MEDKYLEILRRYFGYDSFRGIQKEIVESIGSGRDTLGLMPTGGGKSVTFQVPALAQEGVCLVITPLVALMKDQVEHLRERGILAAYINSSMNYNSILQTLDNAIYGGVKFLYVSPERLSSSLFQTKVQHMKVCFIAVDEAHCISQWGYDFRPSYLQVSIIRELLPGVPVLALTATATPEVVDDIQDKLCFTARNVYRMSFKRENLVYVTRKVMDKQSEAIHILSMVPGSAIVYTRNRKGTKEVAKLLCDAGISATFYHAGLDFAVKDQRQLDWQQDKVRVMVATNAFGMGIDKPDVRVVIHLDTPDSLEAYFQEAGRGGRDGKRSYAVLLYDSHDVTTMKKRIDVAFPPKDYIRQVYDHLAYFFQQAIDSGEGASYEFDIERFCLTFKHFPTRLESAISILQRAGYIDFDPDPDNHPRVHFLISRDKLYGLREMSKAEEDVITQLLRHYGNLFSDFGYVEVGLLSQKTGLNDHQVHVVLKGLSQRNIIKYIPRRHVPRLTYVRQRIDSSRLRITEDVYENLRDRMIVRVDAMSEYLVRTDVCRQKMLLKYFGEEAEPCGACDVCLSQKQERLNKTDSVREQVVKAKSDIERLFADAESIPVSLLNGIKVPRNVLDLAIEELRGEGHLQMQGSLVVWK